MASSPLSWAQSVCLTLAVFVGCAAAFPPRLFAHSGRREEVRLDLPIDCSPRLDGSTPVGCADTVAGRGLSYDTSGEDTGVVEVVDGLDAGVQVVEDARGGTFVIRVPQYQPIHRRGCPYRHVFVAELGKCVRDRTYRQLSFRYPGLTTRLL